MPGSCRYRWTMPTWSQTLLREAPAAFHAGVQDILLIGFALAVGEFLGANATPIGIDVEGHGRHEELAGRPARRPVAHRRLVHHQVPRGTWGGRAVVAQVVAGDAALGAVIKDAKEQLRALPDGLTYGLLRYLNDEVDYGRAYTIRRSGSTIWAGSAAGPRCPASCGRSAGKARRSPASAPRCRCR